MRGHTQVPQPLARRIDRLARRAHVFHRFAHHPLCPRYGGEVIRLGRRGRACLGCSLAIAGATLGLGAGLLLPPSPAPALLLAALILLAAVPATIRLPGTSSGRAPKFLTRFLPTAAGGATFGQALAGPSAARIAAAAVAAAGLCWAIVRYRRRGPDRAACADCPEGPAGARCPGLAPIARRERAFSRLAGRWIAAATRSPAGPMSGPAGTPSGPRSA